MNLLRKGRFAALAVLYTVGVIGANLAIGRNHNVSLLLAVVPIMVAFERDWRWAAAATAIPIVMVSTNLFGYDTPPVSNLSVRIGGVIIAGAFATYAARTLAASQRAFVQTRAAAEAAQRAILPVMPKRLGPYALSSLYRSSAEEALVGGDFYKVIASPWGARIIVGDVEGKGLAAVSMSSLVLGCFREWAPRTEHLRDLVSVLDERVRDYEEKSAFVTSIVGTLSDDLTADLANCGHLHPVLARRGKLSFVVPAQPTTPLGLGSQPELQRLQLEPGDRLFFFTDGLTETRSSDGRWVALEEVVTTLGSDPLEIALDRVASRLTARGKLADDLAMLLVEVSPLASLPPEIHRLETPV